MLKDQRRYFAGKVTNIHCISQMIRGDRANEILVIADFLLILHRLALRRRLKIYRAS